MVKKAVILCGGLATRFLPISKSVPKEMLPLLDKPILQVLVENLKQAGITDAVIVLGRGKECIIRHFDHNIELENRLKETNKLEFLEIANKPNNLMHLYYKMQDEPKGTAHAIKLVKSFIGNDPFVLMFGDEVMFTKGKNEIEQLVETYEKYGKSVISAQTCPWEDVSKYGIISPKPLENGASLVLDIIEKPKRENAPSNLSYLGLAVLNSDFMEELETLVEENGKELVVTDAYLKLAKKGKLVAQEIIGDRHDMGNKFGFVVANIVACLNDENFGVQMKDYILNLAEEIKNGENGEI